MTAIAFTEPSLLNAKRALVQACPDSRSAHLSEALAAACGYATHAALRAALQQQDPQDPDYLLLDDEAFTVRLDQLEGINSNLAEAAGWFDFIRYPTDDGVVRTLAASGSELAYTSKRARAWRNVMVGAINAGIARRLFTVVAGDNRWPNGKDRQTSEGVRFEFDLDGIPAVAWVDNAGWDELSVHVALWPTADCAEWINASNAGFLAGEVFAQGWLERQDGAWLQFNGAPMFSCRRHRLAEVLALTQRPQGFADCGPLKL
ncbi:hypothetical protein [Phenylobacterium sp.]|uniref:hypothetical protein n=1 Tax=Phenylobacterium sp. TaxID=1871053 RepID=UPI0035644585